MHNPQSVSKNVTQSSQEFVDTNGSPNVAQTNRPNDSLKKKPVLFDSYLGPYQVLPLRANVYQRAMVTKGYSTLTKDPSLRGLHHQIV